jgi:nucleoside-diphosphate kinase
MAKTVRGKSIRAVYGKDKGRNAVHCTDLEEDGVLEVEYFFNILQKK